jgi:ADP-glucose pyrophosphorylase
LIDILLIFTNAAEPEGGFPFSGKYRAIDFFRSLSFELQ